MPDPRRDRLDLSTTPATGRRAFSEALNRAGATTTPNNQTGPRRWLGIHFTCCNAYARIYRHPTRPRYEGRCPRCNAALSVPIGNGGTSERFFQAY